MREVVPVSYRDHYPYIYLGSSSIGMLFWLSPKLITARNNQEVVQFPLEHARVKTTEENNFKLIPKYGNMVQFTRVFSRHKGKSIMAGIDFPENADKFRFWYQTSKADKTGEGSLINVPSVNMAVKYYWVKPGADNKLIEGTTIIQTNGREINIPGQWLHRKEEAV